MGQPKTFRRIWKLIGDVTSVEWIRCNPFSFHADACRIRIIKCHNRHLICMFSTYSTSWIVCQFYAYSNFGTYKLFEKSITVNAILRRAGSLVRIWCRQFILNRPNIVSLTSENNIISCLICGGYHIWIMKSIKFVGN